MNRSQAPAFYPVQDYTLPKPERHLLDNGQPLHIWRTHTQPVVALQALFPVSVSVQDAEGVPGFVGKMLTEGTEGKSYQVVADTLAEYGAYLTFRMTARLLELDLFCLPRFLPKLLPLVQEILQRPSFEPARLEQIKQQETEQLLINQEKTAFLARQHFNQALFGTEHPSGKILTPDHVQALTAQQLRAYFDDHLRDQPGQWFLTGNFPDQTLNQINTYLGQHPLRPRKLPPSPPLNPQYDTPYFQKSKALQTSIRIGTHTLPKNHHDYPALTVLNEIFGGYFGSRLMQNLREDKGYTYGVSSRLQVVDPQTTLWVIGADVKKEHRADACQQIYHELHRLTHERISDTELETVKNYLSGSFVGALDTPFAITEHYKHLVSSELPPSYYDTLLPAWHQVSAEEIQRLAAHWSKQKFVEIMVG
ncbi:MAG: M16 family metallopeptidase [Bernardetiaceae bacterium]